MRFVGRGHPNIRATHDKTFELTPDADITARATCVVAVDVRTDDSTPCAGPIDLTLAIGDLVHRIAAHANSSWQPGSTAVVRRSAMQLPGTFATRADASAADLPRPLIDALKSPDAVVHIDVTQAPSPQPTIVLYAADPSRPADVRLRAELAAADRVVAEDEAARVLARPTNGSGSRALVAATRELPGASVLTELSDRGTEVETVGLAPQLAAAAACPSRAPMVIATEHPAKVLRAAKATHRVVVSCPPDDLGGFLELAADLRPGAVVTIAQEFAPPMRVFDAAAPQLPADARTYCCVAPAVGAAAIDASVQAAVRALIADGVSTRTAARALAELAGLGRREAYDIVLQLSRSGR